MDKLLRLRELIPEIEAILTTQLPGFYVEVRLVRLLSHSLKIVMASSTYQINDVAGKYPDRCSLALYEDLELTIQSWGGLGGGDIWVDPISQYLAMSRVPIPFRKPKRAIPNVLTAIETFATRYKDTLKANREKLYYRRYDVDYDKLLN